jgi:hypothetical protein
MAKKLSQKDIDLLRSLYARVGSSNADEARRVLGYLLVTLKRLGLAWPDLLKVATVQRPFDPRYRAGDLVRLRDLHDLLGPADDQNRETIVKRIGEILERYRANWIDVLDLIASAPSGATSASDVLRAPSPVGVPNPLDLLTTIVPEFLDLTEDEVILLAVWIVGTYAYRRFTHFPRLALLSPVRGCGKSTALKILKALTANSHKTDNITSAGIYHLIDQARETTLLMDEVDNQNLPRNHTMRSVLNSGHERGGTIDRYVHGEGTYSYSTYCPLALGAIGSLPLPLMDRSWTIHMVRTRRKMPSQLHRPADVERLEFVRQQILDWVQGREFDVDPALPWEATSRRVDNARVLVSVADACSAEWGHSVRDALVRLSRCYRDEDLLVILLRDICAVFDAKGLDRIRSTELVAALVEMEDQPWREFQGIRDNQQPRKLTPSSMALLLKPLMPPIGPIRSKSIRFKEAVESGFYRSQFERAWQAFVDEPDIRTQASPIRALLR